MTRGRRILLGVLLRVRDVLARADGHVRRARMALDPELRLRRRSMPRHSQTEPGAPWAWLPFGASKVLVPIDARWTRGFACRAEDLDKLVAIARHMHESVMRDGAREGVTYLGGVDATAWRSAVGAVLREIIPSPPPPIPTTTIVRGVDLDDKTFQSWIDRGEGK